MKMKKRLRFAVGAFFVMFGVLAIAMIRINAKTGKEYEQRVLSQQGYSSEVIPYKRGDIVDTNGTVLATTKKVYNLILEPKNILQKEEYKIATTDALKKYFGMTDAEIAGYLANKDSYYEVARTKLEYDIVKKFKDFDESEEGKNIRGIYFEESYQRIYPNDELACHLVGFTVSGNVGANGLEASYDEYLNGTNGRKYSYLNEDNGLTEAIEPAINGYNIVTSIDANIQKIVEEKVNEYMETEGAANVSVLVMDPSNCNVLALYNSHTYNPNDAYNIEAIKYQFETEEEYKAFIATATDGDNVSEEAAEALGKVWRNFVVSDAFEPGSTYKTFTIAGALEESIVNETDTFNCDGGEKKDTWYIQCHAHYAGGHGTITLSQALENSCNDALMQIADKEGAYIFDKYQILFGFGQCTNVDIPGEPTEDAFSTVIYHEEGLNEVELATSAFGQGVCATMMQVGTAFCSAINGGYYYEPSVVQRIEDENGNIITTLDNVLVRKTISEDVSAIMREELFQVVEQGTGQKAAVEGYEIGGKTGTAEKLPRGNGKYLISFIGFAPIDNPQVVVYVVVDEPNTEDQSSSAASSYLFAEIAKELFPYMNIYKTNDNYGMDNTDSPDEIATPIYDGEAPENDVAGGEDNPYVSNSEDGENSDEDSETEDDSEDDSEDDYSEDDYSEDGYNEEDYSDYSEDDYYDESEEDYSDDYSE